MVSNWDARFISMTEVVGSWSKDRSTKIGCVIVGNDNSILSTGFNGFPRGIDDNVDYRHERPEKYIWTEHAERNAIYNAARNGVRLAGSRIYCSWFPCSDCARAIIQSGITSIMCDAPDYSNKQWGSSFFTSWKMMIEADVEIRYVS